MDGGVERPEPPAGRQREICWARLLGGPASNDGKVIAANESVVVVTGDLTGEGDFGGEPLTSAGDDDVVVVALDAASGTHRWSRTLGGPGREQPLSVALTPAGNVVVAVRFWEAFEVDGWSVAAPSLRTGLVLMLLSGADGTAAWVTTLSAASYELGALEVRADGVAVLGAALHGELSDGTSVLLRGPSMGRHAMTLGLSTEDGALQWASLIEPAGYAQKPAGVTFGLDGTVFVTGGVLFEDLSGGDSRMWIASLDGTSGSTRWYHEQGPPGTASGHGIAFDGVQLLVGGYYSGAADLGLGPLPETHWGFIAALDPETGAARDVWLTAYACNGPGRAESGELTCASREQVETRSAEGDLVGLQVIDAWTFDLSVAPSGRTFLTGRVYGDTELGTEGAERRSADGFDLFVACLEP